MTTIERIAQELKSLNPNQLEQLAQYLAFLKYQSRFKPRPSFDESKLAALYAEFAGEDREFAEEGMDEYAETLAKEDAR